MKKILCFLILCFLVLPVYAEENRRKRLSLRSAKKNLDHGEYKSAIENLLKAEKKVPSIR